MIEKVELNKNIRKYDGNNSFILSLQKQLKTNKNLKRIEFNNKSIKILSDKQYESAKKILESIL
jgi:hypothetical protein